MAIGVEDGSASRNAALGTAAAGSASVRSVDDDLVGFIERLHPGRGERSAMSEAGRSRA